MQQNYCEDSSSKSSGRKHEESSKSSFSSISDPLSTVGAVDEEVFVTAILARAQFKYSSRVTTS